MERKRKHTTSQIKGQGRLKIMSLKKVILTLQYTNKGKKEAVNPMLRGTGEGWKTQGETGRNWERLGKIREC